jgi:hypothetical protein
MQADLLFMVLFSGSGRLQRAYHAKPVQAMALLPALKNPSRRTRFAGKGVVGV